MYIALAANFYQGTAHYIAYRAGKWNIMYQVLDTLLVTWRQLHRRYSTSIFGTISVNVRQLNRLKPV